LLQDVFNEFLDTEGTPLAEEHSGGS